MNKFFVAMAIILLSQIFYVAPLFAENSELTKNINCLQSLSKVIQPPSGTLPFHTLSESPSAADIQKLQTNTQRATESVFAELKKTLKVPQESETGTALSANEVQKIINKHIRALEACLKNINLSPIAAKDLAEMRALNPSQIHVPTIRPLPPPEIIPKVNQ